MTTRTRKTPDIRRQLRIAGVLLRYPMLSRGDAERLLQLRRQIAQVREDACLMVRA